LKTFCHVQEHNIICTEPVGHLGPHKSGCFSWEPDKKQCENISLLGQRCDLVLGHEDIHASHNPQPLLFNDEGITPPTDDAINPKHYKSHPSGVECITVIEHMSFNIGNCIKYLWRAGLKGSTVEDLKKASWYLNREIERLTK
jgi:hypothetical protein